MHALRLLAMNLIKSKLVLYTFGEVRKCVHGDLVSCLDCSTMEEFKRILKVNSYTLNMDTLSSSS